MKFVKKNTKVSEAYKIIIKTLIKSFMNRKNNGKCNNMHDLFAKINRDKRFNSLPTILDLDSNFF